MWLFDVWHFLPDKHSEELKCVSAHWRKSREARLFAVKIIGSWAECVILSLKTKEHCKYIVMSFLCDILMTSNYFFFCSSSQMTCHWPKGKIKDKKTIFRSFNHSHSWMTGHIQHTSPPQINKSPEFGSYFSPIWISPPYIGPILIYFIT